MLWGGWLYPILGKSKLMGAGLALEHVIESNLQPDYLMGCSLAFSRRLVDEIGLMDESYFMYSEEVDWQLRAIRKDYSLTVIESSRVNHVGAMSSGGHGEFYHYYRNRAAIMFNRKFYGTAFALLSAINLSLITILLEYHSPRNVISGVKGAFAGILQRGSKYEY